MKPLRLLFLISLAALILGSSCKRTVHKSDMNVLFLHHSTGEVIWRGQPPSLINRAARKVSMKLANFLSRKPLLLSLFEEYNKKSGKNYSITEMEFPKVSPYGWNNNPFDYYNIWVYNAGDKPFKEEPTLEMLTKDYQVIIFKHCYPISNIQPNLDTADINSYYRSVDNYKLQYLALRDKIHTFPDTKFILFTGAAQVEANVTAEEAARAQEFFKWVTDEWDQPGDNIYIWDLYSLETEGTPYLRPEYASGLNDSHPNKQFAQTVTPLLFDRIIDVIEDNGNRTTLTGKPL